MNIDELTDYIKNAIITGNYSSGYKINELRLSRDLCVKRNLVREAIRNLEVEDFVYVVPNKGAIVSDISEKDIIQIYDILSALESLSVRIATPLIDEKDIEHIEHLVGEMEKNEENVFEFYRINYEFHNFLTNLSGNKRLIKFVKNIRQHVKRASLQSFYNKEQIKSSLKEHSHILAAIKKRDALLAEDIIKKHYIEGKQRLIRHLFNTD